MVSIDQSDADADQNKIRFVVVWIYISDSFDYSQKNNTDLRRMDKISFV